MASSRIFLCLAAACCCCCCITLLPPPVNGCRPAAAGLQAADGGVAGGRRRLHLLPVPEPRFVPTQVEERRGEPVTTTKRPRPAAAWSVTAPELRAVPGGPDPLHHHGGSPGRRPEQDRRTTSP